MKVKDPVCGMTIESTSAPAKGTYEGQVLYFCADTCRRTYERTRSPDPE